MMTRKDFKLMASNINALLVSGKSFDYCFTIAQAFAVEALRSNPRFNKDIFYKACGFEADEKLV